MAAFPSYLILAPDNFGEQPAMPPVYRTPIEQGPPKQLKRFSRVLVSRQCTYLANSKEDFLAFLDWYKNDINSGADWFDWTDPVDGEEKQARIQEGQYEARPWEGIPTLERWEISLVIEFWR